MRAKARSRPVPVRIRKGRLADIDALLVLEQSVFTVDHLSRRSFRNFLTSPCSVLLVADEGGGISGYVHVLFRPRSRAARLYSIGVAARAAGRGIGIALLKAGEQAARKRRTTLMRLEVQSGNRAAIARYEKSGYRRTGRLSGYYNDGSDALRYEKLLVAG
ncbi:MAG: GNAT family N-acetyltransferase [Pseudorhodoplanes sp.]|nr:GNAT family N-acetyltransferase [Pseudorhodoplanes sp.]